MAPEEGDRWWPLHPTEAVPGNKKAFYVFGLDNGKVTYSVIALYGQRCFS